MSTMIQPNGTPGRSYLPKRSRMSSGEQATMQSVKAAAHEAYMAVYREALRALAAREIGRAECHRRLEEAGSARNRAAHDAAEAIRASRAGFAQAA